MRGKDELSLLQAKRDFMANSPSGPDTVALAKTLVDAVSTVPETVIQQISITPAMTLMNGKLPKRVPGAYVIEVGQVPNDTLSADQQAEPLMAAIANATKTSASLASHGSSLIPSLSRTVAFRSYKITGTLP
ncbi:MAG: hypothetical protein E6Q76_14345 [Rhizobium sp.]|nr:MAG: hypothetical protein E6Q76_14345 [Rhizobium sp.]